MDKGYEPMKEAIQLEKDSNALVSRLQAETIDAYTTAIMTLMRLAKGTASGAWPAAMVLLSAHNSHLFKLPITALCGLDDLHFKAAMQVIAGRVELRIEPHELFPNGSDVFKALAERYAE